MLIRNGIQYGRVILAGSVYDKMYRNGRIYGGAQPVADTLSAGDTRAMSQVMTWEAGVIPGSYYQLQRSQAADFSAFDVLYTGPDLNYTDVTVMPGTTYYYRMVVKYAGLTFAPSNVVSVATPALTGNVYEVGTSGAGTYQLIIDGSNFTPNGSVGPVTLQSGDTINIIGSNYYYLEIYNIQIEGNNPLLIKPKDAVVNLNGNGFIMWIESCDNVRVTGKGTASEYGIQFSNNNTKSMYLGVSRRLIVDNMSFTNTQDYTISMPNDSRDLVYNAADPSSYYEDIKLLDIKADSTGPLLLLDGDQTATGFKGVIKRFEIARCRHINSPDADVSMRLGMVDQFDIHDNVWNNVNTSRTNHSTLLFTKGTGKFYSNKATTIWGNFFRFWPRKLDSADMRSIDVFNNIFYDTLRYGSFEFQVPDAELNINPAGFYQVDAVNVKNNTAGWLGHESSPISYRSRLIDAYDKSRYGTLTMNNNLLFQDNDGSGLFVQYDAPDSQSGNIYSPTQSGAVEDVINFASLHEGVGASL